MKAAEQVLGERIAELEEENRLLREDRDARARVAARAVASYQQRALQMEIIRQQNDDLDRLAADLVRAKRAEEERSRLIEEGARLKSEFLANFSHEIRTPLNGIIGYCDLLGREEGSRLTAHGRRDLNVVKANAKTLLSLINDILDLSKIESGRVDIVKETVDVGELAGECASTVKEMLKGKDVQVTVSVAPAAEKAFTDALKLRQIMLNLLSNAAKFTDSGEIVVEIQAAGKDMIFSVEDTGVGIPADQLGSIFEKFRQVDGSSTRKVGGTGLGLAIVRELARILGGQAHVTSALGRGSKFTVVLPGAISDEIDPSDAEPAPEALRAAAADATVLIVDDDPLVQHLLQGQLEDEGFKVLLAADGVTALRAVREHHPTLVVLDIHLPRLDGWSVLSAIKADPTIANTPVIILSVEEQRSKGFSLGACEYLLKPVEPEKLSHLVRRVIAPGAGEVLVVDDDALTRELVVRQLRKLGFSAAEAADGEEALLRARLSPPALLILDLVMPTLDGFEVLRRLRAEGSRAPVIVLTGKELEPDEHRQLRDGMARVVAKGGQAIEKVVEEARRTAMERRAVKAAKARRILYVEDSPQNRDIVRRYLQDQFEILEAEDGEHGLHRAAKELPDLILMDLSLPRIDGWECTRRILADPQMARIPVIALTAHSNREDQDRARKAGCVDYLTKPVERDVLLAAIQRHIGGARLGA